MFPDNLEENMRNAAVAEREERTQKAQKDPNLFCYGCAHAAASFPFPGKPSGERPCCFCVRNKNLEKDKENYKLKVGDIPDKHPFNGFWYDGSPAIHNPMDCYQTIDMMDQASVWDGIDPDTTVRIC
jgi:hypothetical protein